ncbi:MAG: MXAN_5187 family protein [Kofleriaceae bacterium]
MFWSKIWFFLVAAVAAVALAIALVMPKPAQRAVGGEEARRLTVACGVVGILLEDDARKRVDLAGSFAREPTIEAELAAASGATSLDEARMKKVRTIGDTVMKGIQGARKPDFAILIDKKGRVVSRIYIEEADYNDVLAGRPLVDDALAGYLRDDLWFVGNTMYFASASPVVKDNEYVGAVVLGHKITNEFATRLLGKSLLVDLGVYRGADTIATTHTLAFDQATMQGGLALLKGPDLKSDCSNDINKPLDLKANNLAYTGLVARLPGEAGARGAFYAVFTQKPPARGFAATLDDITQDDLGFGGFPWIIVVGGFVVVLGVGIVLMLMESDRPLRRLAADAVRLGKGELERLPEDAHPGKFGSIARSVNIHIDKLGREAKTAKKDLDQLLGPAPEGSLGTIDLLATALPSVRPGGPAPAIPPPPSEFRFGDSGAMAARPPPVRAITPAPIPSRTPPQPMPALNTPMMMPMPPPQQPSLAAQLGAPPLTLDDDILGGSAAASLEMPVVVAAPRVDPYFKQVFDQFIAVKKSCNEPTSGLTYEKFAEKLVKNRDELKAKTGCREVRFTVYVKDGKAALKATPVKEE